MLGFGTGFIIIMFILIIIPSIGIIGALASGGSKNDKDLTVLIFIGVIMFFGSIIAMQVTTITPIKPSNQAITQPSSIMYTYNPVGMIFIIPIAIYMILVIIMIIMELKTSMKE